MYLSAYTHRRQLLQITERWLSNQLAPDDALQITRIITYDSFIAWHTLVFFVQTLTRRLEPATKARILALYRKKDLKDFITATCPSPSRRAAELIADYRRLPEYYFVGSPMAGYLFHDPAGRVLSICRFKRTKRIAEKSSRYAALHMRERLRRQSERLVLETAAPPDGDIDPTAVQRKAEETLMATIRDGGLKLPRIEMKIRDVVGAKIIDWGFGAQALETAVTALPGARILEKEIHQGTYNAVHYTVALRIEADPIIAAFAASPHRQTCRRRGLPTGDGTKDFETFIHSGATDLSLDLILTTYEELLESEIGHSMHEARIFRQRQEESLLGNIPANIGYIIEYLLAVGLSPVTTIDEIPIKLWGRYLPDTLSYCIRKLYGIPEYTLIDD
jgi:hypothetical protein